MGVTIEEDIVSVGLSTLSGAVLDKRNIQLKGELGFEQLLDKVIKAVLENLEDNCLDKSNILGIGIGIFPTMYKLLNVTMENGEPDYSYLKKRVGEITSIPLVIDNSVKGSAMANIDFLKDRTPDRINTAFLQYGNSLHFAVTNLNDPIKSYDNRTDFVNKIIVNPHAQESFWESGKKGCARDEITPDAIVRKAKRIFSADKTPQLYEICSQNPENITIENISQAISAGDENIRALKDEVITYAAVLLNNLYFCTNPQKIILHNFRFFEADFEAFVERVREIGGDAVADSIGMSIIEDKHRFLAGCALAIRSLFYTRGGFDSSIL